MYKAALVLVTSDTCCESPELDKSGGLVVDRLNSLNLFERIEKTIVPDDQKIIEQCIKSSLVELDPTLIITVGGTGLCPRDVTPEATSSLYEKHCNGIATALLYYGLRKSPYAALSRLTSGIIANCLIVNFPGGLKACKECSTCLEGFIEHALEQVRHDHEAVSSTHQRLYSSVTTAPDQSRGSTPTIKEYEQTETQMKLSYEQDNRDKEPTSTTGILLAISSPTHSNNTDPVSGTSQQATDVAEDETTQEKFQPDDKLALVRTLPTSSPYPLIDHSAALEIMGTLSYNLLETKTRLSLNSQTEAYQCIGCVLTDDLGMKGSLPRYDVSTMDGYVVHIPESYRRMLANMKTIPVDVVSDLDEFSRLERNYSKGSPPFFCYQVNTGGRLPEKNFAVVPAENAGPKTKTGSVSLSSIEPGKYIRKAGSDLDSSDFIRAGTMIGPVELSIILAMGHKSIEVFKRPIVGLLSTGDEIVDFFSSPESTAQDSVVVDTNGPLLASFFKKTRDFKVISYGIAKDDPKGILSKITTAIKECDVLIVTGGASMGSKDHVKDVIEHLGGTIHFGRVNIKPGKPAAFASLMVNNKRKFIFSLPGNPVSAYITTLILVMPFIDHGMRSHCQEALPLDLYSIGDIIIVKIDNLFDEDQCYNFDGRLEFARAKILKPPAKYGDPYPIRISFRQQSSRMLSLKDFDCLVMIDPSSKGSRFHVGQTYQALKLKN